MCCHLNVKFQGQMVKHIPRRRSEDIIKRDPKDIGWEGVEWINLIQDKDMYRAVLTRQ
jgi:hypothetical protein